MIVEILYTVQVSFREHALIPEPFLIVGLIAGIRRVLVLTAEFGDLLAALLQGTAHDGRRPEAGRLREGDDGRAG